MVDYELKDLIDYKRGYEKARKEGAKQEINFFLNCLRQDKEYSIKLNEHEKKQSYIQSLILVMEERLKELG